MEYVPSFFLLTEFVVDFFQVYTKILLNSALIFLFPKRVLYVSIQRQ